MGIDIKKAMADIHDIYKVRPHKDTFNALWYGLAGTGKTYASLTCRRPMIIHSFDPGGTKCIRDHIGVDEGVVVDTRFEWEEQENPTVYQMWGDTFDQLKRDGVFNSLGTYVIDSATMWADAMMDYILHKAGKPGAKPEWPEYYQQHMRVMNSMKEFARLPCDCILIGHIDTDKDESTGKMFQGVMITGKLKIKLPILFDEIYKAEAKETPRGIDYRFLTATDGTAFARTRLGSEGRFEVREEQNVKALLKKAGMPCEDKPF